MHAFTTNYFLRCKNWNTTIGIFVVNPGSETQKTPVSICMLFPPAQITCYVIARHQYFSCMAATEYFFTIPRCRNLETNKTLRFLKGIRNELFSSRWTLQYLSGTGRPWMDVWKQVYGQETTIALLLVLLHQLNEYTGVYALLICAVTTVHRTCERVTHRGNHSWGMPLSLCNRLNVWKVNHRWWERIERTTDVEISAMFPVL